jgi:hypothetical protein
MVWPVIAAAVLTVASLASGEEARKDQRRAARIQQRLNENKELREKQQQLRSAIVQRAQIVTAGAAAGVSDSSAVQGGADSIQTQAAANVSFINQISSMNEAIYDANVSANKNQSNAAAFGAAASLAGSFNSTPTTTPTTNTSP